MQALCRDQHWGRQCLSSTPVTFNASQRATCLLNSLMVQLCWCLHLTPGRYRQKSTMFINKWANTNNQMLNKAKCAELIITRKRTSARSISPPPQLPDLSRVEQLTLLGVELDERLSFSRHIDTAITTASQNLYALKTLKSHGLPPQALDTVCRATLLARLTYASPCWWGALSATDRDRLQAVINRAVKWGVCQSLNGGIPAICDKYDHKLFSSVLSNNTLPPPKTHTYSLRKRSRNLTMSTRDQFTPLNFIHRM